MSGVDLRPRFGAPTFQSSISGAPGLHLGTHFGAPSMNTVAVENMASQYTIQQPLYIVPPLRGADQNDNFPAWAVVPLGL